jgi:lysophospholipase L1-like esterase
MNASMRTTRFLGSAAVAALLWAYNADHALATGHSPAVSQLAVVTSAQEPANKNHWDHGDQCGHDRQWSPAWGARGPLSTTITTKTTFNEAVPDLSGATLRIMAHLTTGGSQVRVRFSQRFSTVPLVVDSAHVAIRQATSGIVADTDRALSFGGATSLLVPAGGDVWSDPVRLQTHAGEDLAISFYVSGSFVPTTYGGRGTTKTSYYQAGNHVSDLSLPAAKLTRNVFGAYEVQVLSRGPEATLVALGDSITEGAVSTVDANGDWPDLLAARMPRLPDGTTVSVINAGIGSGRFIASNGAGLCGLSRLNELLAMPRVRWVTLLMGVNDISYEFATASLLENAYAVAISEAHAAGKTIIGIPIFPFGHSVKDEGSNKQVAQEVNTWIRAHDKRLGAPEPSFDAVVDLEPVVKDPNDPDWAMNPALAAPDRVHPNQAGYTAIANAFPLEVFYGDRDDDGPRSDDCRHDR